MDRITIIRCDDGAIWVASDDNPIGTEVRLDDIADDGRRELYALAKFLGLDICVTTAVGGGIS